MNTTHLPILLTTALCAATLMLSACSARHAPERAPDRARGRYLVEQVALCQDCHSPRDEQGRFVPERWLTGAPLPFTPTVPMPWAPASKPIVGLPGLDDAQALTFLTTGVLPGGRRPLPPMPDYRLSPDDARDVIAYLKDPIQPTPLPDGGAAR